MKKLLLIILTICLIGCDKTAPTPRLTKYVYELHHGDKVPIQGEYINDAKWISNFPWVATANNGYVYAKYVGEALITSPENRFSINVSVKPKYKLFENSYNETLMEVKWGMSSDNVLNLLYVYNSGFLNSNTIGVSSDDSVVPSALYHFSYDKLDYYAIGVNILYSELLVDYLSERYEPLVQVSTYDYAFMHCDKNDSPDLLVYVSFSSSLVTVIFCPPTTTIKSSNEPEVETISNALKQLSNY